ncbi:hypothetical protein ZWY2020_039314 [Hordeum vulgare]|nr:hypothetical protein ZWY2020_039314 [Hordeum vulgare]
MITADLRPSLKPSTPGRFPSPLSLPQSPNTPRPPVDLSSPPLSLQGLPQRLAGQTKVLRPRSKQGPSSGHTLAGASRPQGVAVELPRADMPLIGPRSSCRAKVEGELHADPPASGGRARMGTAPAAGPKAAASPSYTLGVKLMDEDDERGCLEGGRQDSTVYCDGVQQASEDPEDQTALTSRLSVKHVVEVMQKFDDYKRWLVSEIGFEGMLNLPRSGKIDLRMSAWIMRKVKVKSRTIVIDKERVLLFALEDFHKIFGVPCGNRVVRGRDGEIKNTTIEFMKQTIGMNASPAHNLKVAENFITRDISEESSKIEKDCFQISFVIFVMGYVLSPGTKHEYMTIDFWGALANAELISQFNWCEYAVDNLMSAVMKVQTEYNNKAGTIHMSGCHLFFQNDIASFRKLVAFEVFRLCDEHANFVAESVPRITFDEPGE